MPSPVTFSWCVLATLTSDRRRTFLLLRRAHCRSAFSWRGISAGFMEAIPRNVHEEPSSGCFPRFEHLQFSGGVGGRPGFQHRYLDATCCPGLARPHATYTP